MSKSAEIFYFTGTGNSLVVARDIADKIDGRLTPVPLVMEEETVKVDADVLGIVCPTYYTRTPGIVERFIGKLANLESKYVFAIVTVGGIAGGILDRLSEMVGRRGGSLAAGFVVRMPANYIHASGPPPLVLQKRMFRNWEKKAVKIADDINHRKTGQREKFNPLMTALFSKSIEKQYLAGGLAPDIDKNFHADDKCNACGICVKVCPVNNVVMAGSRPVWRHHCEKCLACIQWCPEQAIQFKDVTLKRKRYHHPGVKLSDVLKRN